MLQACLALVAEKTVQEMFPVSGFYLLHELHSQAGFLQGLVKKDPESSALCTFSLAALGGEPPVLCSLARLTDNS